MFHEKTHLSNQKLDLKYLKSFKTVKITTRWLREKCRYSELFWPAFSRIRTKYGEIRSISMYSVRMQENTDQSNSEYGHFLRRM